MEQWRRYEEGKIVQKALPRHFPALFTTVWLNMASDPCYRGTPTGQGRGVAKVLIFFLSKTLEAGKGLSYRYG
jgi:hypothetical protein